MIRQPVSLFILLLIMACQTTNENDSDDTYSLNGQLLNAENVSLELLELTTNEVIPVGSFRTDSTGHFSFTGDLAEASFFLLRADKSNYITLLIEPGEALTISGNAENLPKGYEVKGSAGSELLKKYYRSLLCNQQRLDSLAEVLINARYADDFADIRKEVDQSLSFIFDDQQRYVKRFIKKNPRSLASIIALYQFFGNKLLLNQQDHFSYFESLSNSLSEVYPTNKHVLDLNRRVSRKRRDEARRMHSYGMLEEGVKAPEVVLPDPDNQMLALSSFRGQYVLIDFWASWCTPCRYANRQLRELYDQYHPYGFEIFGISLDRSREQWVQGIKEDGVIWPQVSDLRVWNSPVVSLYNIERIPCSILVGPDGRIVQRNMTVDDVAYYLSERFDTVSASLYEQ